MALIIVMVALLNATFLKPINRVLGERERRTKGRLTEAQRALLTVDERIREYERRLREARAQGYALMEEERAVMSREREKRVADVRSEITSWLSDQKQTLSKNAEQVKVLLKADARNRALEISRHILRREIPQGSITT
jgi:F-type H+-transporting ATPase subunit b